MSSVRRRKRLKRLLHSKKNIFGLIVLVIGACIVYNFGVGYADPQGNNAANNSSELEDSTDTTWQNDYVYKRDKKNGYLILSLYKGKDKNITVPAKAIIDGVEYKTMIVGLWTKSMYLAADEIDSLTIEDGVMFPPHDFAIFNTSIKKLKIGNVDLSMLDSLAHRNMVNISEELDLSDFDNTNFKRFEPYGRSNGFKTSKVILGKNVLLKKSFYNMSMKFRILSSTGYWLREGTNEVYSDEELLEYYDRNTMYGTYTAIDSSYVIYNPNGGVGYIVGTKVSGSTRLRKNTFTRYGYEFTGWNTNEDGTGVSYSDEAQIDTSEKITLYAQWSKVDNNTLNTKQINLKYHFSESDGEKFDLDKPFVVNYYLKLKKDGKYYTEDIVASSTNKTDTLKANNGVYTIKYSNNHDGYYSDFFGDNLVINVPEGFEYELVSFNGGFDLTSVDAQNFSGTTNDNNTLDAEATVPVDDVVFYYLDSFPYEVHSSFSLSLDNHGLAKYDIRYDGDKTGTISGRGQFNLAVDSGDIITFHDFPIYTSIGTGNVDIEENLNHHSVYFDYSGGLGYANPINYLFGSVITLDYGVIYVSKDGNVFGLGDKQFGFKLSAYDTYLDRPLTGKYPYTIYSKDENKILEEGKLEFNESGEVEFKLRRGEYIIVGSTPYGYNYTGNNGNGSFNYSNGYDDYIFFDGEGILSNKVKFTVEELEDSDSYDMTPSREYYVGDYANLSNSRKICRLNVEKKLNISSADITYYSVKKLLNNNVKDDIETNYLKYYIDNNENIETFLLESLKDKNDLEKIKNESGVNDSNSSSSDTLLRQYIESNDISELLKEEVINNLKENIFNNKYKSDIQFLENLLRLDNKKVKMKVTIKDDVNFEKGLFPIALDDNGSINVDIPVNYVLDGNKLTNKAFVYGNFWCGSEYEIDELDSDNYIQEKENTKGKLVPNDNNNFNNVSITNTRKKGSLTLTKKTKGDISKDKEFTFKIKLTDNNIIANKYQYTGSKQGTIEFIDDEAIVMLKSGESITINDLPYGSSYEVTEENTEYENTIENGKGIIKENTKVVVTNYIVGIPLTLDNIIKYLAIFVLSLCGIVFVIKGKKQSA